MGFPSWSDGTTTVTFSVGARTPFVPSTFLPAQIEQEASDRSLQVVDLAPAIELFERTYEGIPADELASFLSLWQGSTVKYKLFSVTWTAEDATATTVRIMQVTYTRMENGDYILALIMREEI